MAVKIGVFTDLRFTALNTPTGVSKHIVQMVKGLYHQPGFEVVVLAAKDQLNSRSKIPENNALSYLPARPLSHSWHRIYWQGLLLNTPYYDKFTAGLDWVYCPKNDYLPLKQTKYAVTFHGAHEIDPEFPNPKSLLAGFMKWRSKRSYRKMVEHAHLILSVSKFLKQKTVEWFNANPSKIAVVGNGVEEEFYSIGKTCKYNPYSYYLSVGGLNFLDGGDRIIELAEKLQSSDPECEIWIAGNQHEPNLKNRAEALNNIKLLGYLHKTELAKVMSKASALLFLTRYETFGIAAAEAMAVGLPVITVKSTAVPEIVNDGGFYIEEVEEIIDLISTKQSVLSDKINIGKEIAEKYHWKNCVERLVDVLKEK